MKRDKFSMKFYFSSVKGFVCYVSPLTNEMFTLVTKFTTSEALFKHVDITVKVALVKKYTDKTFNV